MGKVHGSLARAGKVRGQTPKVAKQDKKKQPRGRAHKRIQYNRRFVTAVVGFGKKRGPNSSENNHHQTPIAFLFRNRCCPSLRFPFTAGEKEEAAKPPAVVGIPTITNHLLLLLPCCRCHCRLVIPIPASAAFPPFSFFPCTESNPNRWNCYCDHQETLP
ncbi:unnamed protein product [Lactuca virosa]|uniref:40S ribosomal protein S30 n=1 Tax=Lactuca virosa TaxID=75947 RepID=A0AAU9MFY7_9ASTR|nr:unnamed protein product [Lactuca virosa]